MLIAIDIRVFEKVRFARFGKIIREFVCTLYIDSESESESEFRVFGNIKCFEHVVRI